MVVVVVVVVAGSAGLGVCAQLVEGMVEAGLTREEALSRFVVCTHHGALGKQDGAKGDPNYKAGMVGQREKVFVNNSVSDGTSLLDAMQVGGLLLL